MIVSGAELKASSPSGAIHFITNLYATYADANEVMIAYESNNLRYYIGANIYPTYKRKVEIYELFNA